jgi:hypothetical protein
MTLAWGTDVNRAAALDALHVLVCPVNNSMP